MNQSKKRKSFMIFSIIFDADQFILDEDYTEDFKKEYGIISIIPTGYFPGNGCIEIMMTFQDKKAGYNYIREFDMDYNEMIMNPILKDANILEKELN